MNLSLFPTLKGYRPSWLVKDIQAGLIIAAVSIPISMGYAEVAGLPAVYGLYGSLLPILCFALFSTSPLDSRSGFPCSVVISRAINSLFLITASAAARKRSPRLKTVSDDQPGNARSAP